MKLILFLCVMWSAMLSMIGSGNRNADGVAFALGWAPTMVVAALFGARALFRQSQHAAMLKALGMEPGENFEHSEETSGIAVMPKTRTVALRKGGRWKTYSFAEVRGWRASIEHAGMVGGAVNLQHALGQLGPEIAMKRRARANTGLFVSVRDVDRAEWRVAMKRKSTQARWMEILQQQINESQEGGVAATA